MDRYRYETRLVGPAPIDPYDEPPEPDGYEVIRRLANRTGTWDTWTRFGPTLPLRHVNRSELLTTLGHVEEWAQGQPVTRDAVDDLARRLIHGAIDAAEHRRECLARIRRDAVDITPGPDSPF